MSSETTPAEKRAIEALPLLRLGMSSLEIVRPVLTAALDVEEISRAAYESNDPEHRDLPSWNGQTEHVREYWRRYGRAIRTAILGSD